MDDRSDAGAVPPPITDAKRDLIDAAATVRTALASKRSDKLSRLFDFLLSRTLDGKPPSELEIADAVFSTGRPLDVSQDATVRVYVHRLRKTLDQIYDGQTTHRLHIPRGDYRVVLDGEDVPAATPVVETPAVTAAPPRRLPYKAIWLGLALLALVNLGGWWLTRPARNASPAARLADTRLWRGIARDTRPITIVLGDYYMYSDATDAGATPRFVRDPAINSRQDLDVYLMRFPVQIGRLTDHNLNYVPTSSIVALGDVYRATRALRASGAAPRVVPVSQLTPDIMKNSDVIYLGLIGGLGSLLRNPLFQASGFKVGASYDELVDAASGRHFVSDGVVIADEHVPRRDYGYLASVPGPSGNHLVVIASLRDPALLQMAELARDPDKLRDLDESTPFGSTGFEALYQVRTMGSLNLSGQLLIARSLHSRGVWDTTQPSQRFPDDSYDGAATQATP